MTWWLGHWTTNPEITFTFKGNLEIPRIQTMSYLKKKSTKAQWDNVLYSDWKISGLNPAGALGRTLGAQPHYKDPGDFWVELVTAQWLKWVEWGCLLISDSMIWSSEIHSKNMAIRIWSGIQKEIRGVILNKCSLVKLKSLLTEF